MTLNVLGLDAATYVGSELHHEHRVWVETNCYVDLWIEVLHSLGLPPQAAAAFALSIDYDDDQFRFFKFPAEDLRALWGIEVYEMNPWLGLDDHLNTQLGLGRLMTIEVDAWFLPDTAGVSYQTEHTKTTIAVQLHDRVGQRLGYFHNQGYYEIDGDNYRGALGLGLVDRLMPYTEVVRLDRLVKPETEVLVTRSIGLVRGHLRRRPASNPVSRFREQFDADVAWLVAGGGSQFHQYAFVTLRQLGAAAEMASSLAAWLTSCGEHGLDVATESFLVVATRAKTMQFKLARAAAGRPAEFNDLFDQLEAAWANALDIVEARYGD